MTIDLQQMRINGVYPQRQPGFCMLRVKVPGGLLTARQALKVAEIAERFGRGVVHLTTRTSIEFHWLEEDDATEAIRLLATAGLTTRGACGGAVRGVVCSAPPAENFPVIQALVRSLHDHFAGNPLFEGLPKKFKIGVFADTAGSRHLIQDVGLVAAGEGAEGRLHDVWTAGGLGREPVAGFLLAERLPARRVIPLIEAVIGLYRERTPPGKRLKHLVREIGREEFRTLAMDAAAAIPDPEPTEGDGDDLAAAELPIGLPIEARPFAGELSAGALRTMSEAAHCHAGGRMALTAEQNVLFHPANGADREAVVTALASAGVGGATREERVVFRVCPGSHECRLGLAPTRDLAGQALAAMGPAAEGLTWAVAGCPNSCSQPQLADIGIVAVKLPKGEGGEPRPLFDLYRRAEGAPFGDLRLKGISREELLREVAEIG
jgi:sulfite reductase (ferredoxin)